MQTTCQFLGIHTEEIESAAKSCEAAMEKLGFTIDEIDDMNDYAKQELEEIGSWSDITNSIERKVFDCESSDCAYNHGGECRFARVHERRPEITKEDGCWEAVCAE